MSQLPANLSVQDCVSGLHLLLALSLESTEEGKTAGEVCGLV